MPLHTPAKRAGGILSRLGKGARGQAPAQRGDKPGGFLQRFAQRAAQRKGARPRPGSRGLFGGAKNVMGRLSGSARSQRGGRRGLGGLARAFGQRK
jgi:hypothetical protein